MAKVQPESHVSGIRTMAAATETGAQFEKRHQKVSIRALAQGATPVWTSSPGRMVGFYPRSRAGSDIARLQRCR